MGLLEGIAWVVLGAWAGVQLMILVVFLLPRQVGRSLMETDIPWGKDLIPTAALLWALSAAVGALLFTWLWRRRFMRRES